MEQACQFSTFHFSLDPTEIGHYPQTRPHEDYNPSGIGGIYTVRVNRFPDQRPFYKVRLHETALLTDFLQDHALPSGLLVSPKVKECLSSVSLPPHQFYEAEVQQGSTIHQYHWLFFIFDMWDHIQCKGSTYVVKSIGSGEIMHRGHPTSKAQFLATVRQHSVNSTIQWERICFQQHVKSLDMITFSAQLQFVALSDYALDLLRKAHATGFESKPTNLIYVESPLM